MSILRGTSRADTLHGSTVSDTIFGYGGNDRLSGQAANDTLYGGNGNDRLDGNAGNDAVYGGSGDNIINGYGGNDRLFGGSDRDLIYAGDGNDFIYGGDTQIDDLFDGGNGNDTIYTGSANRTLFNILGGAGDDRIYGGDLTFSFGQDGNDLIFGGFSEADGGNGEDVIKALIARGGAQDDRLYTGVYAHELGDVGGSLNGDSGNDRLSGNRLEDYLYGGAGNDLLYGGAGNDILAAFGQDVASENPADRDAGDDTLTGGAGEDRFVTHVEFSFRYEHGEGHIDGIIFDGNTMLRDLSQDDSFVPVSGGGTVYGFGFFDSNLNGRLDRNDDFVRIEQVTLDGKTRLSTIISDGDPANGSVTFFNERNVTEDDFGPLFN